MLASPERGQPFSLFEPAKEPSRWLIVGEAPGEEEDRANRPFIGASGKLLNQLLEQAGFRREQFAITNVFTRRPPDNDLKKHWTLTKTELQKRGWTTTGRLPKLGNRYIHPEHEGEVARLREEIRQLNPEFILALGGTALWAITGETRITLNRGTLLPLHLGGPGVEPPPPLPNAFKDSTGATSPTSSSNVSGQASQLIQTPTISSSLPLWAKSLSPLWLLPSFHPAMVLRQWDNRPLLWADLVKARRFLSHQLPPPLRRRLLLDPTLDDLASLFRRWQQRPPSPADPMGVDIETDPRIAQITTISFGFADEAVCIPFYDKSTLPAQANYWPTAREEAEAWLWVKRFAALPHPKVGQNFLYDHQYLLEDLDIRVSQINDDTAILQHSLQPELPKALGTLASLYLNEPAWKLMRGSVKDEKADD